MLLEVRPISGAGQVQFRYSYSGEQLSKSSNDNGELYYLGGYEFTDSQLRHYQHGEGRYNYKYNRHEFVLRDHLGNNMVMYGDYNEDGRITDESQATPTSKSEIPQRTFYYAFGLPQKGWMDRAGYDIPTIGLEPENAYLYNGWANDHSYEF